MSTCCLAFSGRFTCFKRCLDYICMQVFTEILQWWHCMNTDIHWSLLDPFLTAHLMASFSLSGKVRSCMLHGSETWPVKKENEMKQQCTEAEMKTIEWMCGVKLKDKLSCVELIQRLEIQRFIWISKKMDVLWRGGCYMYMQAKDKMEWVSLGILWDADVYGKWRRSD